MAAYVTILFSKGCFSDQLHNSSAQAKASLLPTRTHNCKTLLNAQLKSGTVDGNGWPQIVCANWKACAFLTSISESEHRLHFRQDANAWRSRLCSRQYSTMPICSCASRISSNSFHHRPCPHLCIAAPTTLASILLSCIAFWNLWRNCFGFLDFLSSPLISPVLSPLPVVRCTFLSVGVSKKYNSFDSFDCLPVWEANSERGRRSIRFCSDKGTSFGLEWLRTNNLVKEAKRNQCPMISQVEPWGWRAATPLQAVDPQKTCLGYSLAL